MRTLRPTLSAALSVACLLAAGCGTQESQENEAADAANASQQQVVPELPIPAIESPIDREQLLVAAIRAASDFAAGTDDKQAQKDLADKKFEFRIRFGCDGPGKDGADSPFDWSLNARTGALKVQATPTLSLKDPPVKAIAGEAFETVEGFWIGRPWLLTAACPRKDGDEMVPPTIPGEIKKPSGQQAPQETIAIAEFFTATGPRTMRRSGRPYEATTKVEDATAPAGGFDLILAGRLVPLPDGRVIACTRSGEAEQPSCIISVEFGKVTFERADTHEQLAQWGSG